LLNENVAAQLEAILKKNILVNESGFQKMSDLQDRVAEE